MDKTVSPASVLQIWGDVVRDSDQLGLKLTRISDREEIALGDAMFARRAWPASKIDPELSSYVGAVGAAVAAHARRKRIPYRFHVVESSEANAFALPGGHVIVTTAMLAQLNSEAELAAVLGHEIAHVDLRHCVERYQYRARLGTFGAKPIGMIVDAARIPAAISYRKYQELDADAQGLAMATQAGYDPRAGPRYMVRFAARLGADKSRNHTSSSPIGEAAEVSSETLREYFLSHPLFPERIARMRKLAASYASHMAGRTAYIGKRNYQSNIPRSVREFPDERVTL